MRELKGLRGGRVDLITMPSPGMEPLTTILTAFSRAHPDVTVNAEAGFTPEEVLAVSAAVRRDRDPRIRRAHPSCRSRHHPLERQVLVLISGPDDAAPTGTTVRATTSPGADSSCPSADRDAGTRRRRPRQRNRGQHRRRNRPPHIDPAHGAQRNRTCRDARILDPTARRSGARVQSITPQTYLHVAAVSRRTHLTAPATALMTEAQAYAAQAARRHLPLPARHGDVLASSGMTRKRYTDAKSRRNYAGTSPLTVAPLPPATPRRPDSGPHEPESVQG